MQPTVIRRSAAAATSFLNGNVSVLSCLAVFLVLYGILAAHAFPENDSWLFDAIEAVRLFAIDDAYRFFESRAAWFNPDAWSWMYLLPADLAFNGALHTLTDSSFFAMRMAHVLLNFIGVFFLYRSCLLLGIRPGIALLACLSMLSMPLFIVVSMSFYGESVLMALLSFAIYAHLSGRRYWLCLVGGIMPLVHQEGLIMLLPFLLYYLWRKDIVLLLLVVAPGFLYFLNILYVHSGVMGAFGHTQLHKLYPALPTAFQQRGWSAAFVTLNPLFVLLAAAGGIRAIRAGQWPVAASGFFWFLLVAVVMSYYNGYEARYLAPCLPFFFLLAGLSLDGFLRRLEVANVSTAWSGVIAGSLMVMLVVENLGQSDPLRAYLLGGQRWPYAGNISQGANKFVRVISENRSQGEDVAGRIENFMGWNPEFKLLAVNSHEIFYFLDRRKIPQDVKVVFSPFVPLVARLAFDNRMLALSSNHPQAAFYRFSAPDKTKRSAVFVGDFSFMGWTPAYANGGFRIYEVGYEMVAPPERLRIIERIEGDRQKSVPYWTKSSCPEERDYICPEW